MGARNHIQPLLYGHHPRRALAILSALAIFIILSEQKGCVAMQEQLQIIFDLLGMFRRRIVLFSLITISGVAGTIYYALQLPHMYETIAVIRIESPQISSDLARSTAIEPTTQRIRLIEQDIMSRDNILALIDKYNLFVDAPGLSAVERVAAVRQAITLRTVSEWTGYGPQIPTALTITVRLNDPELTALVANGLVTAVLERNVQARVRQVQETFEFFAVEENRLSDRLEAIDEEILEFKRTNEGSLPSGLDLRQDELSRLSENNAQLRRQLNALNRERFTYENPTMRANLLGSAGLLGWDEDLAAELRQLESEFASKERVLAPNSPELRRLSEQIAILNERKDQVVETLASEQLRLITQEEDLLQRQLADNRIRLEELRAQISNVPSVEDVLNGLLRAREQILEQYSAAVQSRAEAEIGQRLEINRQSERFEVLETALVPEYPVAPSRKKIAVFGLAGSLAVAGALVLLLELLNPVLRTTRQMTRQLDIIPVVALPHITTDFEIRRRKYTYVAAFLIVGLGVPVTMMVIDRHIQPLENFIVMYREWLAGGSSVMIMSAQ